MATVRERLAQLKQSPVTTELMPALLNAGRIATAPGFTSAMITNIANVGSNAIPGDLLFDSVIDGNNTTSENMSRLNDGLNLRLYRIDEARIPAKSQGLYPIEEIIPICFCPTFALMKDSTKGMESIDDFRENLRLAAIAIYSEKNFPSKVSTYRRAQPETKDYIPMSVQNYVMNFENKKKVSEGDNWYSIPFTIFFVVKIQNFI